MKFQNSFDVDAPVERVWQTLMDLEQVAPLVPGAEVLERSGDNAYKVGIKVKLGPMTMNYRGDVEIVDRDDGAHRALLRIKAREARGQGTADAEQTMSLAGDDGHASATLVTDVKLSGRVASMGRGIVEDVARRMIDTFAGNLAALLEGGEKREEPRPEPTPPPPEAPAPPPQPPPREDVFDAGALAGDVVGDQLRRPPALAALLAAAFALGWLIGRRGR